MLDEAVLAGLWGGRLARRVFIAVRVLRWLRSRVFGEEPGTPLDCWGHALRGGGGRWFRRRLELREGLLSGRGQWKWNEQGNDVEAVKALLGFVLVSELPTVPVPRDDAIQQDADAVFPQGEVPKSNQDECCTITVKCTTP